jgi:hypothetical protein
LIYGGPNTGIWYPPQISLKDLPLPSGSTGLSGSRKVDVFVTTASGPDAQVQADVSWNLTPAGGSAPTTPPDVTGSVSVNGPPLGMSITNRSQRGVVGLPIIAGQKVTVKVTGNTIGPVKVSLVKPGGGVVTVASSANGSFDLPAQTLKTSGTYSIVVVPSPGSTGSFSVAATSP